MDTQPQHLHSLLVLEAGYRPTHSVITQQLAAIRYNPCISSSSPFKPQSNLIGCYYADITLKREQQSNHPHIVQYVRNPRYTRHHTIESFLWNYNTLWHQSYVLHNINQSINFSVVIPNTTSRKGLKGLKPYHPAIRGGGDILIQRTLLNIQRTNRYGFFISGEDFPFPRLPSPLTNVVLSQHTTPPARPPANKPANVGRC